MARLTDLPLTIGHLPSGPTASIVDVPGVGVGHATVWRDEPDPPLGRGVARTGVTVVLPHADPYRHPLPAGGAVLNGAGECTGLLTAAEWGLLESPIFLTSTMQLGRVYDAACELMLAENPDIAEDVVIPMVAECDDSHLNDARVMQVSRDDVAAALAAARAGVGGGAPDQGAVGAGAGMSCLGFKGGIGTASRVTSAGYTVGVLLLTNFGSLARLTIDGLAAGPALAAAGYGEQADPTPPDAGSCIGIVLTDAPVDAAGCTRLARRVGLGLARAGSVATHGSGEIFVAASTATAAPRGTRSTVATVFGHDLSELFAAVVEASEEAVLASMLAAPTVVGRAGHTVPGLPVDAVRDLLSARDPSGSPKRTGEQPPVADRQEHVRHLHGEAVDDPYFWMRDLTDPRLLAHLDAERAHYEQQTAGSAGDRQRLAARLRARLPQVSAGCPWWVSGRRHQLVHREGAQYPQLLRRLDEGHVDEVLLDVPGLVGAAAYAELGLIEISDDGRYLAYSIDLTGDEVYELRWRDLATGRDLVSDGGRPERVGRSYYGGAWTADGSAFYYVVHDETYRPHQVWRHRRGSDVATDELVFVEQDRRFEVTVRRTRSGAYVLLTSTSRTTCHEQVLDAGDPAATPRPVRPRVEGVEDLLEHERARAGDPGGGRWLLLTNEGAEEFRLLTADCRNPLPSAPDLPGGDRSRGAWVELVAARPGSRLEACDAFAGGLVLTWRRDGNRVLEFRPAGRAVGSDGETRELLPPHPAATLRLGPNHDYDFASVVVETTSLIEPSTWWEVALAGDPAGGAVELGPEVHRQSAPGHDPARYLTCRISVPARDGTPIPVTLAYARNGSGGTDESAGDDARRRSGTAPGLLYGYGAYESSLWPEFDPALPVWLDHGLVHAVAHVRGGGEGGRTWWRQGCLRAKVTTFTDHLDVAAALVRDGWVAPDRLATRGLSAGGLLQGAVLSMRPQQWAAVVAEVPFVDCVNSMLDDALPLTVNEWQEWGDPRDPDDYAAMRAYTPYENLPARPWPAILVTGALHDPRVVVHEPAKWVAALRAEAARHPDPVGSTSGPLLFRAETGPGAHAGPAGRYAAMDYEAEVMTFVLSALRVPVLGD